MYQVEMMLILAVCAGVSLDRLEFFRSLFEARRGWVTLLQMPPVLHLAVNLLLTARAVGERAIVEPIRAAETESLRTYMDRPGPVFTVQYDAQGREAIVLPPTPGRRHSQQLPPAETPDWTL